MRVKRGAMDHLKSNTSSNPYNFWRLIRIKMLASVCDMSSEHPLVTTRVWDGRLARSHFEGGAKIFRANLG